MKLIDVIFCDDIRKEANNKYSLMGLYNDKIIFKLPTPNPVQETIPIMQLGLFLRFELLPEETRPNKYAFKYFMNEEKIIDIYGDLQLSSDQNILVINLITQALPLKEGNLGYTLELFKDENNFFKYTNLKALNISFTGL